jgi:hypothetical protein
MAEVITAFDPEVPVEHDRQRKYPWDQWFDGQIWRLTPGVDFENHSLVIERQIRTRASARKVAVHIQHGPEYAYLNIQATPRPEPTHEQQLQALVEDAVETAVETVVGAIEAEHDGHTVDVGPSTIVQNDGEVDPATVEAAAPSPTLPPLPTAPEPITDHSDDDAGYSHSDPVPSAEPETVVVEGVTIPVVPMAPTPVAEPEPLVSEDTGIVVPAAPAPDPVSEAAWAEAETPDGDTVLVGSDEPTQQELDADTADASKHVEEPTYEEQLASAESVPDPVPDPVPTPPAPAPAGPFQAPVPPVPTAHPPLPHPAPVPQNPFGGLLGQWGVSHPISPLRRKQQVRALGPSGSGAHCYSPSKYFRASSYSWAASSTVSLVPR